MPECRQWYHCGNVHIRVVTAQVIEFCDKALRAQQMFQDAQQMFQEADRNTDGFLTKSELRKYFKKNPQKKNRILGSEFHWNEFFTDMDKNGDNKFDLNEFTDFVTRASLEEERKLQVSLSVVCRP